MATLTATSVAKNNRPAGRVPDLIFIPERRSNEATHEASDTLDRQHLGIPLSDLCTSGSDNTTSDATSNTLLQGACESQLHQLSLLPSPPREPDSKVLEAKPVIATASIPDTVDNPINTTHQQFEAHNLKERIPYVQPETFIFYRQKPERSISERASDVIYQLYGAVQDDPSLRNNYDDIHFRLYCCGQSAQGAQPSIVCFCKPEDVKSIRSVILNATGSGRNNDQTVSSRWSLKRILKRNKEPQETQFRIVYWVSTNKPYQLLHSRPEYIKLEHIRIETRPDSESTGPKYSTLCGSSVWVMAKDSTATIACVIMIDSKLYALTVAHPFPSSRYKNGEEDILPVIRKTPAQSGHLAVLSKHSGLVLDDMQYDFPVFNEPDIGPVEKRKAVEPTEYSFRTIHQDIVMALITIPAATSTSPTLPDLDWALIELHASFVLSNAVRFFSGVGSYTTIERVASSPPEEDRPVLIIVAHRDPLKGILLHNEVILPGINRPGVCSVCEIVFEENMAPVPGDSGALVVDAETFTAYAYVVALSPFGDAYAVPLISCLHQIRDTLGVKEARFPTKLEIERIQSSEQDTRTDLQKPSDPENHPPPYDLRKPENPTKTHLKRPSNHKATAFIRSKLDDIIADLESVSVNTATIPAGPCSDCSAYVTLVRWEQDNFYSYHEGGQPLLELLRAMEQDMEPLTIVIVEMEKIRQCPNCHGRTGNDLANILEVSPASLSVPDSGLGHFSFETTHNSRCHDIRLGFHVKQIAIENTADSHGTDPSYSWSKTDILIHFNAALARTTTLVILDPNEPVLKNLLQVTRRILKNMTSHALGSFFDPYHLASMIAETSVQMHDEAIWSISSLARAAERNQIRGDLEDSSSASLHQIVRHANHVTANINTTLLCIEKMITAHDLFYMTMKFSYDHLPPSKIGRSQITSRLINTSTSLQALLIRSQSIQSALEYESKLLSRRRCKSCKLDSTPKASTPR